MRERLQAKLMRVVLQFALERQPVANLEKPSRINFALRVLDGFFYLCCHAGKRAQAVYPLALSTQYGMIRGRGHFSLDLSGITAAIRVGVRFLILQPLKTGFYCVTSNTLFLCIAVSFPFLSTAAQALPFAPDANSCPKGKGQEWNGYLIQSIFNFSLVSISLFNCIGFSYVGFSNVG